MTKGISKFISNRDIIVRRDVKIGTKRMRDFAETMVEWAKDFCPVDTGNLMDSIDETGISAKAWRIFCGGEAAMYAPFVEFGTSRRQGSFFMQKAFEQTKAEFEAEPWE